MPSVAPWHHAGQLAQGNPFSTFGQTWCNRCKMEVEADTDASYGKGQFVMSQKCKRCGHPIAYAVYCNIPLLSARNLPAMAFEWVKAQRGRDRS